MTEQTGVDPAAPPPAQPVHANPGAVQHEAMRGSLWTAIQAVVGLPFAFVVNIVVARSLGPEQYGTLAVYMAAMGIFVTILNAGVSDAMIQWGAAADGRGDRVALLELTRRCAGFHLCVEVPLIVVAALVLLHDEAWTTQLVAAVALAVTMAVGTTTVALTAINFTARLAKLMLGVGLSIQLAVVLAAVQTEAAGPTWVARISAAALSPVVAIFLAPADIRRACLRPLAPRHWPPGFVSFAFRTLLAGLVGTLVFSRSEVFLLQAFGGVGTAGLFALAAGLATQITGPIDAMLGPLIPATANLLAAGRHRVAAAVERGIRLSGLASAAVAILVVPVVAMLAPAIYGSNFGAVGGLFVAMGLVSCLQSALHPIAAFLMAWRRPMLVLFINGIALVVDLGLAAAAIPFLGAAGAVLGSTVGQVLSLTACTWLLCRFAAIPPRIVVGALVPFGAALLAATLGSVTGLLAHAAGTNLALATLVAAVVAIATGVATIRIIGGAVSDSDLAAVAGGFPRLAPPITRMLRWLGWVQT